MECTPTGVEQIPYRQIGAFSISNHFLKFRQSEKDIDKKVIPKKQIDHNHLRNNCSKYLIYG